MTPSAEERYRQMTPLKREAFQLVSAIVNYNLLKNITSQCPTKEKRTIQLANGILDGGLTN